MKGYIYVSAIIILLLLGFFSRQIVAEQDRYYVSPYAREIGINRVGKQLLRWVRFSSESEHPCLHVELLEPASYFVSDNLQICALPDETNKKSYDFKTDLSSIDLYDMKIEDMSLTFKAELILLTQGSKLLRCRLLVKKERLTSPDCSGG